MLRDGAICRDVRAIDHIKLMDQIKEYVGVLSRLADELYGQVKIGSKYKVLEFGDRVTQVYADSGEVHNKYFDFTLSHADVKHDTSF